MTDEEWNKIVTRLKKICKNRGYKDYYNKDKLGEDLYDTGSVGGDCPDDNYFEIGEHIKDTNSECFFKSGLVTIYPFEIAHNLSYRSMDALITIMFEPEKYER